MDCAEIQIEVLFGAAPREVRRVEVRLPLGATAADAVRASGLLEGLPDGPVDQLTLACLGRTCSGQRHLKDGDRLEVLRPLVVDPKESRRMRHRRDGPRRKRPEVMR